MKKPASPKLEWWLGRPRVTQRRPSDGGPPPLPEAADTAPTHDPKTGRFLVGNRQHRRRQVKERAKGIATLDPKRCASWLRPFVEGGAAYGVELAHRFSDPALLRLIGDTADARTVFRALLHLAAQGDTDALKESRMWLKEHRACLSTLSALSGEGGGGADAGSSDESIPWATPKPAVLT